MNYKVVGQLSGGGFAEVLEVEDTASALPERLVLKRLSAEMSARADVRTAFADEAKFLRELKHPNVVTFRRCYFDESQRVCLLMEKVVGESLDRWGRRHQGQPALILEVFETILQAVDFLHRRPVPFLHLDLKPENILVSSTSLGPQPVLIDFGIARRSGGQGLKAYTPPYGAPEQQGGGALRPATDVHALGQILCEQLVLLASLPSPVRQALDEVCARATNPSPQKRFPNAGEMGIAFRRARRVSGAASSVVGLSAARPFVVPWQAALGVVVLVGLTMLGLRSFQDSPSEKREKPENAVSVEPDLPAFRLLVGEARKAVAEMRFDRAEVVVRQATTLQRSLPPDSAEAQRMLRELSGLRNEIDLARQGISQDGAARYVGR